MMKIFMNPYSDIKGSNAKIAVMFCAVMAVWTVIYRITFNETQTINVKQNTSQSERPANKQLPKKSGQSIGMSDSLTNSKWYGNVMKAIEKAEYKFTKIDSSGRYSSPNRKNNMRFSYDENGFSVTPRTTKIPVGKPDSKKQPHEQEFTTIADWKVDFLLDKKQVGKGRWSVQDHQAEYITDNIIVQYINGEEGMRQNFIVKKPLIGSEELKINFTVKTKLKQQFSGERLSFIHPREGAVLNYDGLKVWDAEGKELAAQFEKNGKGYAIHVNTLDAAYPVTIDPISSVPSAAIESNQANAGMGYSVDGAGDVNKDGFDDIIVGAPYFDNGEVDEGTVFIFHGSPLGINTTSPASSFQSNQAGALAGFSVAGAGDINGDGYDDAILGMPYFDKGQLDEGVAMIVYGSSTGINFLDGAFFELDQANAQTGWAVDGAGDVNGDGFDDLLIGTPNYDQLQQDQGTVTVMLGSANAILTLNVQYANIPAGAKFGWSVAGVGDCNNDGYDDIGIGAPFRDVTHADEGYFLRALGSPSGITNTGIMAFASGQANAQMGYAISSAGDINGDGFDDVMVGIPFFDTGQVDAGQVMVLYGSNNNSSANVSYSGNQDNAHFGMSLASIGDIDGDGYGDVLIGAPDYDKGQVNEGVAFLYRGSSGYAVQSQVFESNQANAKFGQSVAGAMDLNKDGNIDIVIGASQYDNGQADEGTVFLYYGQPNPLGGNLDIIASGNQPGARMGFSVSSAGDVNRDGYSDVVVGSPGYDNGEVDEGVAFLYYGSPGGINTSAPVILEANQGLSSFGSAVSTAGDVNGDGFSDVIIGAPDWSNGEQKEGRVFVFHGSASGIITTPANTVESGFVDARMGAAVSSAGDVDGDGFSDVIIGAPNFALASLGEGSIYIYYGSASGISPMGRDLVAYSQGGDKFGYSVACAGDVNGDGFSDVIASAPYFDHGETDEGIVRLYYGSASGIDLSEIILEGDVAAASFGLSVSGAGDVNGDGYSDLVVGSPTFGSNQDGAFYLFMGGASGINTTAASRIEPNSPGAYLGGSVSGAGDLNGDGFADVVVGANLYTNGQNQEGAAYIYMGSPQGLSSVATKIVETNQASGLMSCASAAGDANGDGYSDLIFGHNGLDSPEENEGGISMLYGAADVIGANYSVKIQLNQADSRLGTSVAFAGDINGDGFSDVIVGAPNYDLGQDNEGIVSVYRGSANGLGVTSTTLQRNQESSSFGFSIAAAGDVNGDGYGDVIIGAPFYNNGEAFEGAVFLYYGSSAGLISGPLLDKNQTFLFFGISVSGAGDVNGDGFSDVLVGASGYSNGQSSEGAVFLYLGSATGINTTSNATLEMNQAGAGFGGSISSAGDVNGDGFADVVIGATNYDNGQSDEGAAFIFHGSASGLNTVPARILEANQSLSSFGSSVANAGDVNGDGFSDVIIGAPFHDGPEHDEGHAFIYHGSATGIGVSPNLILQVNSADAAFGSGVSGAGDLNGDGYSDVIIGAFYYSAPELYEGAAMIFLGSPSGLNGNVAKLLQSDQAGSLFGGSVAGGGDVNGDGFSDITVGASRYGEGQTDEGMAFVYYGNAAKNFKRNNLDLYNTDLATPVNNVNFNNTQFGAGLFARSFMGRDKGKLVWETKSGAAPYSGSPITNSGAFTSQQSAYIDLGLAGVELKNLVDKLPGRLTRIRARVKYNPATAIKGQMYGPWRYVETVSGLSGALPVDLISFGVAWQQPGQVASIIFTTENETEIERYEIEKSTNGRIFLKLVEIAAANVPDLHQYSCTDSNATASRQYYRLRTIHMDGSSDYSRMAVLSNDKDAAIQLYPNPAVDMVNLKMTNVSGKVNLRVINSSGQTVKQLRNVSASERIQILVSDLPSGIYHLHVQNEGSVEVLKFVKP